MPKSLASAHSGGSMRFCTTMGGELIRLSCRKCQNVAPSCSGFLGAAPGRGLAVGDQAGQGLVELLGKQRRAEFDDTLDLARAGVETGGGGHNRRFVARAFDLDPAVPGEIVTLAHDAQTSGGLLAAIDPSKVAVVEAELNAAGVPSWRVGHVEAVHDGVVPGVALVP